MFALQAHLVQTLLHLLRRDLRQRLLPTIGLHRAKVQELSPTHDQIDELLLLLRQFAEPSRIDVLSELGQHPRVEAIGLGENPQAFGEVTHLPRVDYRDAIPGFNQFRNDDPFVAAGGFQDNGRALARRATAEIRPANSRPRATAPHPAWNIQFPTNPWRHPKPPNSRQERPAPRGRRFGGVGRPAPSAILVRRGRQFPINGSGRTRRTPTRPRRVA
jgi:hypothetical protein